MIKRIFPFLILLSVLTAGCVSQAEQTTTVNNEQESYQAPHKEKVYDYMTFECSLYRHIGRFNTAPTGKCYAVVDLHINNQGTQTYSTNPWNWELKANGITYQHDTATYDDSINQMTVDVGPGGKIDTQIVFLINGEPSEVELIYKGW